MHDIVFASIEGLIPSVGFDETRKTLKELKKPENNRNITEPQLYLIKTLLERIMHDRAAMVKREIIRTIEEAKI